MDNEKPLNPLLSEEVLKKYPVLPAQGESSILDDSIPEKQPRSEKQISNNPSLKPRKRL